MHIAFIHPHRSFLPELDAYQDFFSTRNIRCSVHLPEKAGKTEADVEWHFMGWDQQKKDSHKLTIHEYGSSSLPPLASIKNWAKSRFGKKPDFRVFLNAYVERIFDFADKVPFGYRDMGIYPWQPPAPLPIKRFDFVYTGSVGKERNIDSLLQHFTRGSLERQSLLILSRDYESLKKRYSRGGNIFFQGPVPYASVSDYLCQARYAINYVPDKAPFNRQTSTKLLEYANLKLPILTTSYDWVRGFEQTYGGCFFYLLADLSNFTWDAVNQFAYGFPALADWSWERQINKSGVLEFLQLNFQGLSLDR